MTPKELATALREWQGALDDPREWDQGSVLDEIGGAAMMLDQLGAQLAAVTAQRDSAIERVKRLEEAVRKMLTAAKGKATDVGFGFDQTKPREIKNDE